MWSYPGAVFLSAGGYHHHLGTNTWSATAPTASERDARLLEWTLVLPEQRDVRRAGLSLKNAGYDVEMDGEDRRHRRSLGHRAPPLDWRRLARPTARVVGFFASGSAKAMYSACAPGPPDATTMYWRPSTM